MNLFLYSDHIIPANRKIDDRLLTCIGERNPTVVWVPAGNKPERVDSFFANRRDAYAELGVTEVSMIQIHESLSPQDVDRILDCDILHLSGGDPYVFTTNLRTHGLLDVLRARARKGRVLVGDSAGAMIMTPSVRICDFHRVSDPPQGFDMNALGLVDFEIHPHWGSLGATEAQIKEYSREHDTIVYCFPDGSGVAVIEDKIEIIGTATIVDERKANKSAHTTPASAPR